MPVTKISISPSPDALAVIDSLAADQGITRSAWIEQAAVRAARQAAVAKALREYERESGHEFTAREVESARRRIYGEPPLEDGP